MKHLTTHESFRTAPPRTPACTLEEARRLLAELKAEYDSLSPDERRAVRETLKDAAAEASSELPPVSAKRPKISLPVLRAYGWHAASCLGRLGWLALNFLCDPITVLPAIVSGLWKPTPRESDNHVAN